MPGRTRYPDAARICGAGGADGGGGRILTHTALLERVWGNHRDDIDYLRVVIRALRVKLEVDPAQPTLIRNEPGIGYRLIEAA